MNRKMALLIGSFLLLSLTACSSTREIPDKNLSAVKNRFIYGNSIPIEGNTKLTFKIPQGKNVTLVLLNDAHPSIEQHLVSRVRFNDADCHIGHQGSINFQEKPGVYATKYFAKEAAWNEIHTLSISFAAHTKKLRLLLDDQLIEISPFTRFNYIGVAKNTPFDFISISHDNQ